MSRTSASSRDIEWFRLLEDAAPADVIPAGFDCAAIDKIDFAAENAFEGLFEVEVEVGLGVGAEGDQEVGVAANRVKIIAARRAPRKRTEGDKMLSRLESGSIVGLCLSARPI
jgi:hypothetical protein